MSRPSIKNRLFAIILLTSTIALLVTGYLFIAFQSMKLKQDLRNSLALQSNVIADNVQAAILFEDTLEAERLLASLRHDAQVIAAFLLNGDKEIIGRYQQNYVSLAGSAVSITGLDMDTVFFQETPEYVVYAKAVISRGNKIGYVVLYADYSRYQQMLDGFMISVAIVIIIGIFVSLTFSWVLQKLISGPIESLALFVGKVALNEDYALRIGDKSYLEIEQLGSAFNSLLTQIGQAIAARDQAQKALQEHSLNLQDQVYDRTRELEQAKEAAEQSSKAKSTFLANISHEIRTPMNAIVCFTQLALENAESRQQKLQLNRVLSSSELLLSLLNDLLDISRIDAGKMVLDIVDCNLYELIEEINQMLVVSMEQKKLEFIIDVDETVPRHVVVDSLRLKQVLINLLTNAVKFTDSGFIRLSVTAIAAKDERQAIITFSVTDTGIGMDDDTLSRVFNVFTQGDVSITRQYGGSGLGLSISKKLLALMDSRLQVVSEPGIGTEFSFSLALRCNAMVGVKVPLDQVACKRKVLVVEPCLQSREHLRGLLQSLGCLVESTDSAEMALRFVKTQPFEFIFIGLETAEREGSTLAEAVGTAGSCTNVVMVVMASTLAEVNVNSVAGGLYPIAFLSKPVYDRRRLGRVLNGLSGDLETDSSAVSRVSSAAYKLHKVLVVDDVEINRILIKETLDADIEQFLEAANGHEAVEMLKKESVDLVLMDVQMPVMDGYQACEAIRQILKLTDLPVIGMTAFASENERNRCYLAGMNEVLIKPLDIGKLRSILLELNAQPDGGQMPAADGQARLHELNPQVIDVGQGMKNLCDDAEIYKALLRMFREKYKNQFSEFERCILDGHWEHAETVLHDLKGASASLSLTGLAEHCDQLMGQVRKHSLTQTQFQQLKHRFDETMRNLTHITE